MSSEIDKTAGRWFVCIACTNVVNLPANTPSPAQCSCSPKSFMLLPLKFPKGCTITRTPPSSATPGDGALVAAFNEYVSDMHGCILPVQDIAFHIRRRAKELTALAQPQERAGSDAERYQWLRRQPDKQRPGCQLCRMQHFYGDELDAAIDRSIAHEREKSK